MGRFVEMFKELGRAGELLTTQTDLIMVQNLQQRWTKVSPPPSPRVRLYTSLSRQP